ncbi:MAG TPA: hypothetical protein VMM78_08955 [Thermomicrobiales bacterium]|nr:hypothetical protein [Thermomicrobiales bacterium]
MMWFKWLAFLILIPAFVIIVGLAAGDGGWSALGYALAGWIAGMLVIGLILLLRTRRSL